MFSYILVMNCIFDGGEEVEFYRDFESPVQFRNGDRICFNGLEEVCIDTVAWYMDDEHPHQAFIGTVVQKCKGKPEEWLCILDDMDYSCPDISKEKEPQ